MFETIHIVFIAVGTSCSVAGWGKTETGFGSDELLWANVLIRNTTECRVDTFITFLKEDLKNLTGLRVLLVKRPHIKTTNFVAYYFYVCNVKGAYQVQGQHKVSKSTGANTGSPIPKRPKQ